MGTKHSAAKTPLTAPMTPAEGGPGMPYTYLNATERDPYAAATKTSSARPYHTLGLFAEASPSAGSSGTPGTASPTARGIVGGGAGTADHRGPRTRS